MENRSIGTPTGGDSVGDIIPTWISSQGEPPTQTCPAIEIFLFGVIISRDFVFVRTFLRFGPSRVLGSPLFSDRSWPSDLMGRAAIIGTLPSPPAKIVDAHSRKLSEVDPERSSSDLIFRKTPGATDRSFLRRLVDANVESRRSRPRKSSRSKASQVRPQKEKRKFC